MTRVVCQQLAPCIGDLGRNVEASTHAIRAAVAAGADVVVLPELTTSGYVFASPDEARAVAVARDDDVFRVWRDAAGDRSVVVGGFAEKGENGVLYNSAVLLAPGLDAVFYRKLHLWDTEKLVFTAGSTAPPVVETAHGRIGVAICYDIEFPELTRSIALRGADLIAVPTNWPLMARPAGERVAEVVIAMAAARVNHVAIACCDRTGAERGQDWTEGTSIISNEGWVVAESTGVATVVADLDLTGSADKGISSRNDLFRDRRTDVY